MSPSPGEVGPGINDNEQETPRQELGDKPHPQAREEEAVQKTQEQWAAGMICPSRDKHWKAQQHGALLGDY